MSYKYSYAQWNIIHPFKKNDNPVICCKRDLTGGHYVKGNKPVTEKQILRVFSNIWELKQKNLSLNTKW